MSSEPTGVEFTRPGWWATAISGPVVRRALAYLLIVGSILILINHGDALLRGDVDPARLFKMFITPLVPYCVSTLSSVSAIRAAVPCENQPAPDS